MLRLLSFVLFLVLRYFELSIDQLQDIILLVGEASVPPHNHQTLPFRFSLLQLFGEADDAGTLSLETRDNCLVKVLAGQYIDLTIASMQFGEAVDKVKNVLLAVEVFQGK